MLGQRRTSMLGQWKIDEETYKLAKRTTPTLVQRIQVNVVMLLVGKGGILAHFEFGDRYRSNVYYSIYKKYWINLVLI